MMVKLQSRFVCQQCGYHSPRWFGKCPECGSWGSAVETVISKGKSESKRETEKEAAKPISLASIPTKSTSRISTKISELDRVLGGGLVPGQVVLIAGEPGIGKSTLLLQVADQLTQQISLRSDLLKSKTIEVRPLPITDHQSQTTILYVSGEESVGQIAIRSQRLGISKNTIQLLEETDIDRIIESINQLSSNDQPLKAIIIDSIQTMTTSDLSGMAGSVGQVRECAFRLVRFAKENNIIVFIVGHVTKEGTVAGPSVLMHIVDTVLWFEGDKSLTLRLLRAVKNRFGPTDEVGIFSMEEKGLISLESPEKVFLTTGPKSVSGTAIASVLEGTRPILIEVQSLIVPDKMVYPKRIAQGMDVRRLELLLAVLQRRCGLPLYEHDVFVNVAGGISIKNDPSADLAICLSAASAFFDKALPLGAIAIGEVGLLGDIREVIAQEKRVREAKRLGYRNIISNREVKSLQEAIRRLTN